MLAPRTKSDNNPYIYVDKLDKYVWLTQSFSRWSRRIYSCVLLIFTLLMCAFLSSSCLFYSYRFYLLQIYLHQHRRVRRTEDRPRRVFNHSPPQQIRRLTMDLSYEHLWAIIWFINCNGAIGLDQWVDFSLALLMLKSLFNSVYLNKTRIATATKNLPIKKCWPCCAQIIMA